MKRDNSGAHDLAKGLGFRRSLSSSAPVSNGRDEMGVASDEIPGWLIGRELFNETKWLPTERTMEGESARISLYEVTTN